VFSRIEGVLREKTEESVLIEAGGLCYDVMIPGCVAEKLRELGPGDPIKLEIFSYSGSGDVRRLH